jgi:Ca2+-binding RTX toxin-like protein
MAVLLLVCALVLALPATASAGAVAIDGLELSYRADPGERNRLSIAFEDAYSIQIADRAGVRAGQGCEAVSATKASCSAPGSGIEVAEVALGDRNDRVSVARYPASFSALLDGGRGNDLLISHVAFRDVFTGGPGDDTMIGEAGVEVFYEGSHASGSDTMLASRKGTLWATADYGDRVRTIHADLDGKRDDGERGEHDLLGRGVNSVRGGQAADRLTGDARANSLVGGGGADLVSAGAGNDSLVATVAGPREAGTEVPESPTGDRLIGGPGQDLLEGSTGANVLDGGAGADQILGLAGPDLIPARDGYVDSVECGTDDQVRSDPIDFLANCDGTPPGAAPVRARSYFYDSHYPTDPPPSYMAWITVACASSCSGTVEVLVDGRTVGAKPFAINAPRLYGDVEIPISARVAALMRRRDGRVSVAVTTDGTGIRAADLSRLARRVGSVPIVSRTLG